MATTYTERGMASAEATGSIAEAAGGIAIIVLSIIGLARVTASPLTAIAVTVLGAALLAEGGARMSEYTNLLTGAAGTTSKQIDAGSGMSSEIMVGGAVFVLGILSLLGVAPATLTAVAIIAAGALMLISAPMMMQLAEVRRSNQDLSEPAQRLLRASSSSASGLQTLAGLAAVVLGILALGVAGASAMATLTLIGLLVIGAALTFSASAVSGNLMQLFSR